MESKFGQKTKQTTSTPQSGFGGYIGKTKTGMKKTKTKAPKLKIIKADTQTDEKKTRKPKDRMDRVPRAEHADDQKQ